MDELHMIGDGGRGQILELLLAKARGERRSHGKHAFKHTLAEFRARARVCTIDGTSDVLGFFGGPRFQWMVLDIATGFAEKVSK